MTGVVRFDGNQVRWQELEHQSWVLLRRERVVLRKSEEELHHVHRLLGALHVLGDAPEGLSAVDQQPHRVAVADELRGAGQVGDLQPVLVGGGDLHVAHLVGGDRAGHVDVRCQRASDDVDDTDPERGGYERRPVHAVDLEPELASVLRLRLAELLRGQEPVAKCNDAHVVQCGTGLCLHDSAADDGGHVRHLSDISSASPACGQHTGRPFRRCPLGDRVCDVRQRPPFSEPDRAQHCQCRTVNLCRVLTMQRLRPAAIP